jgi:hypothetical protein
MLKAHAADASEPACISNACMKISFDGQAMSMRVAKERRDDTAGHNRVRLSQRN